MNDSNYWTVAELSAHLNVHPHWLYRRIALNTIPHYKVGEGKRAIIRFDKTEIQRWLSAQHMDGEGPRRAS